MEPTVKTIPLAAIRIDGDLQTRVELNFHHVEDMVLSIDDGAVLPPMVVFYDGKDYWLADGYHRWHAAKKTDILDPECEIHHGTRRDALLYACTEANKSNGLKLSNEDKRNRVEILLKDEEWGGWSDRKIASKAGVSHTFVSKSRNAVQKHTGNVASMDTKGRTFVHPKTGKPTTMNTANIGGKRAPESEPEATIEDDIEDWLSGDDDQDEVNQPYTEGAGTGDEEPEDSPTEEEPTNDEDEDTDAIGQPLGKHGGSFRLVGSHLVQSLNHLTNIRRLCKQINGAPGAEYYEHAQVNRAIDILRNRLNDAIPYAICPDCKGDGCRGCSKSGYLNKPSYQQWEKVNKPRG